LATAVGVAQSSSLCRARIPRAPKGEGELRDRMESELRLRRPPRWLGQVGSYASGYTPEGGLGIGGWSCTKPREAE